MTCSWLRRRPGPETECRRLIGLSALVHMRQSIPGVLPQAVMAARPWRWVDLVARCFSPRLGRNAGICVTEPVPAEDRHYEMPAGGAPLALTSWRGASARVWAATPGYALPNQCRLKTGTTLRMPAGQVTSWRGASARAWNVAPAFDAAESVPAEIRHSVMPSKRRPHCLVVTCVNSSLVVIRTPLKHG